MNSETTPTLPDTSNPKPPNTGLRNWGLRFRQIRFPAAILAGLSLVFVLLAYYQFTIVRGIEFNNRDWDIRSFSFRRDPLTNFQWGGITYDAPVRYEPWVPNTSRLRAELDPLIAKHFRAVASKSPSAGQDDWDLVSISTSPADGNAQTLVEILSAYDADFDRFWPNWSKDNPTKAALFWPAVQDLVRFSLYARLPDLFELALAEHSNQRFQELVEESVVGYLRKHELLLRERGRSELADTVLTVAEGYFD